MTRATLDVAVVLAVVFETPTRLLARVRPRYLHCGVDAFRDGALEQCVSTIDTCLDKVVVLCWMARCLRININVHPKKGKRAETRAGTHRSLIDQIRPSAAA